MNELFTDKQYLLDTSSLLGLVRYYLPFDGERILLNLVKRRFEGGSFILCATVYDECERVAEGLVVSNLGFLKGQRRLGSLLADEKIDGKSFRERSRDWRNRDQLNRISKKRGEEQQEERYLKTADFNLIGHALRDDSMVVVTEETPASNDRKLYHKIPHIMQIEQISSRCISLPELLPKYVDAKWRLRN